MVSPTDFVLAAPGTIGRRTIEGQAEDDHRIAVIEDGRHIDYATLKSDVARQRAALEADAEVAGTRIALVARPRYTDIVRLCALIAAGATAVLLHPRWSRHERETLRRTAGAGRWSASDSAPAILALAATSGTRTGTPRWVALPAAALAHAAAASADRLGWRDDDRWLLSLPLAHVGGLSILLRCLAARRTVVIDSAHTGSHTGTRSGADAMIADLTRDRVSLLSLVPTQLRRLVAARADAPGCLRAVLVGGAAAPPDLLARAADRGWPVLATYGSTETCSQIATWVPGDETTHRGCGPPLEGTEVRIADGGAIEVRGAGLMRGYLPLEGRQPFTGDGWFRTADLGRLDARGNLHVLGRADDVIVTGGENVHPIEVETALTSHPSIDEALVFGVDDPEWGQTVAALLVSADGAGPIADSAVAGHCGARIAGFKRPRRIAWVESLPRTAAGKPDRRRAARLIAASGMSRATTRERR